MKQIVCKLPTASIFFMCSLLTMSSRTMEIARPLEAQKENLRIPASTSDALIHSFGNVKLCQPYKEQGQMVVGFIAVTEAPNIKLDLWGDTDTQGQ